MSSGAASGANGRDGGQEMVVPGAMKGRALRGILWSFVERIGSQGAHFAITVILARLLTPADFGLVAMLTIFMAISRSLMESGFSQALIQRQDVTRVDESSVFLLNVMVGTALAGALWLLAPATARFYGTPSLTLLMRVLSLKLIVDSFRVVQAALRNKRLDFKRQV